MRTLRIGLIGDRNPEVLAHRAIPDALALAATSLGVDVQPTWIPTQTITAEPGAQLAPFAGLWCVPASPYRDTDGALRAIRHAREHGVAFLGTCGGFQHALLEYARNVLGLEGAAHAELDPNAPEPLVSRLACALVEQEATIYLRPGSQAQRLCGTTELREGYHCSFGLNADYEPLFERGGMNFTGHDAAADVRVLEVDHHPFYLATLFQPERSALRGETHPLVCGFLAACRSTVAPNA